MSIAGQLVGSARRYRGVFGRPLATRTRSSQTALSELERGSEDATSERTDRLLRELGYPLTVLPTRLDTAAAAAAAIRECLLDANEDRALRNVWQLVDDLYDALIAAVCEHVLVSDNLAYTRMA